MTKRTGWMMMSAVLIAVLAGGLGVMMIKAKRFGKKQYYTQITQPGLFNGQELWGYTYEQSAFDEHGKERRLTFLARKNLRLQAYLRVYVADEDFVTAWEEVDSGAIPAQARKPLQLPDAPSANQ